jgi:hypothetical protein
MDAPLSAPRAARRLCAIAAVAAATLPAAAGAQETRDAFEWSGRVDAGRVVYVKNMNGAVKVQRGEGDVRITARKRWRRGDPEEVRVELQRVGGGDVLVCALWRDGTCSESGYRGRSRDGGWWGRDDDDVSVEFTVHVPEGVRLDLYSVNGGLEVDGATAEVRAQTTNGQIRASSLGGPVRAKTVNGSINVRMGRLGGEDIRFETVNGSITVEAPAELNADLAFRTVNGHIESDYPLTVRGRIDRRRIDAVLGSGGPKLEASTVNGSITLRRGS